MYQKIKNIKKRNKIILLCLFTLVIIITLISLKVLALNQQAIKNNTDDVSKPTNSKDSTNKTTSKTNSSPNTTNSQNKSKAQTITPGTMSIKTPTTTPGSIIKTINVIDYGAKGDGKTDDTIAIQSAINDSAEPNTVLLIPKSDKYYKVTNTLNLKSNLHIIGYEATIYMPSQDTPRAIMISKEDTYITNVTIEGLSFKSDNDKTGTGYWADSLTSNIQGIYILGIDKLTISNVKMYNMYNGLKLGASLSGKDNLNVKIDNLSVINSSTPLLIGQTNGFTMTNSTLDADAGNSHWLHSAYIDWGNSNVLFDNVRFINAPGAGVSIGDSYDSKTNPSKIIIKNSLIENANRGFNIYGATDVTVSNVEIKKCNLAFAMYDAKIVNINNINISESKTDIANETIAKDMGAFQLDETYQTNISNITINANTMGGSLFTLKNKVEDINISNISAINMNDIGFFYNLSLTNNFVVEKSNFQWNSITNPRLSFRGAGANAIFRNNNFKNYGTKYLAIADNYINTSILLDGNTYSGFTSLAYSADYSATRNNLNIDTGIYDINK